MDGWTDGFLTFIAFGLFGLAGNSVAGAAVPGAEIQTDSVTGDFPVISPAVSETFAHTGTVESGRAEQVKVGQE